MTKEAKSPEETSGETPSSQPSSTPRRSRRLKWDKVKVFDKPEYRLPYPLTGFPKGRRRKGLARSAGWLEVALESGLVETGLPNEASQGGVLLKPLDDHPPARMTREELNELVRQGLERTLAELQKKRGENKG